MRKIFFTALFFCTATSLIAVGQNIEREDVDINFVRLPLKKLPDTTETYYVKVIEKNTANNNTLGKYNSGKIVLNGYYRLPGETDADVIITTEITRDLEYKDVTLQSETFTYKKNKNSPEISYTAYWYSVSYNAPQLQYRIQTGGGSKLEDGLIGGSPQNTTFGSTSYENHYSSEYAVAAAWRESKSYKLAEWERQLYDQYFATIPSYCSAWCLNKSSTSFNVKYVKEKKTNDYEDLRQAKNFFTEGVSYMNSDSIYLINKVYQPEYEKRKETINKAIAIWEKALSEADFKNKKARIDQKVGRHLYFNLSLAYLLIDNFDKAQQYLQGREDEETKNTFLKNAFAGIKSLSGFIDNQKTRYEANKWRPLITTPVEAYVYKDPETRQREKQDSLIAENERLASQNKKNTANLISKKNTKRTKISKSAMSVKKPLRVVTASKAKKPVKNLSIRTDAITETDNAAQIVKTDTVNNLNKNTTKAAKQLNFYNINDIDSLIEGRPWQITDFKTNKNVSFFKKDEVYVFLKDKKLQIYSFSNKKDLQTSRLESKGSWNTFTQAKFPSLKVVVTSNAGEILDGVGILTYISDTSFKVETYNEQVTFHLLNAIPQYGDIAFIKNDIKIPVNETPVNFLPTFKDTNNPATICIYRPKAVLGLGKNTTYALFINETPIAILKDGDRIEYKLYSQGPANIVISIDEGDNIGNVLNNLNASQTMGLASTSLGAAGLGYTAIQGMGAGLKAFSNKSQSLTINNGDMLFFKIDSKLGSLKKNDDLKDGQKNFNDVKRFNSFPKKLKENIYNPIPKMSIYQEIEKQKSASPGKI